MSPIQKKHVFWLLGIVLAAGIGWYFFGTGSTPLISLNSTNFEQFRSAFNGDAHAPRAVLLLSPT